MTVYVVSYHPILERMPLPMIPGWGVVVAVSDPEIVLSLDDDWLSEIDANRQAMRIVMLKFMLMKGGLG